MRAVRLVFGLARTSLPVEPDSRLEKRRNGEPRFNEPVGDEMSGLHDLTAGQNRQISGTTKTATTKNQIKSGNPSFQ